MQDNSISLGSAALEARRRVQFPRRVYVVAVYSQTPYMAPSKWVEGPQPMRPPSAPNQALIPRQETQNILGWLVSLGGQTTSVPQTTGLKGAYPGTTYTDYKFGVANILPEG
jgi:hypothetical protein